MSKIAVIVLSAAILAMADPAMADPAQAYIVSKEVGPLLKEVQTLMAAKDYKGATAKLNEAEAVKSNPDDETVINQFRNAIAAASSDPTQPNCTSDRMGITRCNGRAIP